MKKYTTKTTKPQKYTIKYENLYFYFMLCNLWDAFTTLRLIIHEKSLAFTPKLKNRTNVKVLRWYDRKV